MFIKNQILIKIVLTALLLVSAGCAHQSKIPPSKGHIDLPPEQQKQAGKKVLPSTSATNRRPVAPIPQRVKPRTQLPPPKARGKTHTFSVVVNEVPVKEILFALARESKLNVDIHPDIQGRVTLNAVDQTMPAILERLAKQVDLTYQMDGNVLFISPDRPVLRNYKIDYVNMRRDTRGFIGSATEISSTGQSASTGANGQTNTTTTSGNGANNSSRTAVTSESNNHLWESLIQNIKDLLAETDKEVIVSRTGTDAQLEAAAAQAESEDETEEQALSRAREARDEARKEYKTLFASTVIANPETGVISVRATNKQHEKVQGFIDQVMGRAKKQVLIEATIVEVRLSDSYQRGIDWSRVNNSATNSGFTFGQRLGSKGVNFNTANGTFSTGNTNAFGVASTAGLVTGYLNPAGSLGNIAASVTLLEQFGDTKVLSSPKLMVLNNQTAVLKVVNNIVYFTVQAQQGFATNNVVTNPTVTTIPNTVPVGVVMSVTPQINSTDNVNINIRPTISSVTGFKRDPNPLLQIDSLIPEIQVREMESVLQINSGKTAVLGGLMQDEIRNNTDQVPGLGDVPAVGEVFKGKNNATQRTELVIFLRPTVIDNASLESDELKNFKAYLPARQLEEAIEEANR